MLKHFGRLIWRQSRDISVMNYANHMVYEIYTNQGYFYISHNKLTDQLSVLQEKSQLEGYKMNEQKTIFTPHLE